MADPLLQFRSRAARSRLAAGLGGALGVLAAAGAGVALAEPIQAVRAELRAVPALQGQRWGTAPCPGGMALVEHRARRFCVDRYEASLLWLGSDGSTRPWPGNRAVDGVEGELMAVSRPSVKPQGYISGQQAELACERAGKRLCAEDEWAAACRGPGDTRYPYGQTRRPAVCNDRFDRLDDHPVLRLFRAVAPKDEDPRAMWRPSWMNDPRLHELSRTVSATGAYAECTNELGVFDMVGNLHEWVAAPGGVFAGGYFMDTFQNGEGCEYRTRAHGFDYHDYSTGFRCCVDAAE